MNNEDILITTASIIVFVFSLTCLVIVIKWFIEARKEKKQSEDLLKMMQENELTGHKLIEQQREYLKKYNY